MKYYFSPACDGFLLVSGVQYYRIPDLENRRLHGLPDWQGACHTEGLSLQRDAGAAAGQTVRHARPDRE